MHINREIFKELIKRGYSRSGKRRIWDVANSKLWYLTPELIQGFLRLSEYPPYRKHFIESELDLVRKHSQFILKQIGNKNFNLIDLGSGDGSKAGAFIRQLPDSVNVRYCPIDINRQMLQIAINRVRSLKSGKVGAIRPFSLDFNEMSEISGMLRNSEYQKHLVFLLGGILSHYDINDLLYHVSKDMFPGDVLVIGNGYRTGKRFVELEKYKSPIFNSWFINIMHGLGFTENEVAVDARFAHGRLEGFYTMLVDKKVQAYGRTVYFRKGDEVITATQYKLFAPELKHFCKMYFSNVEFLADKKNEYSLLVCRK